MGKNRNESSVKAKRTFADDDRLLHRNDEEGKLLNRTSERK